MKKVIGLTFASILICLLLIGFSSQLASAQKLQKIDRVTFMESWVSTGRYAPFYVALDKGYYLDDGMEVRIFRGYGGTQVAMAVDQGKVTFGLADVSAAIVNISKGGKVKIVGMYWDKSPVGLGSLKEAGIKTPKDLEGRTLGIAPYDEVFAILPSLALINKADVNKIKIANISGDIYTVSLLEKKVDVVPAYENGGLIILEAKAKEKNQEVSWLGIRDWGLDVYSTGIVASEKLIKENPDLIKRFLRASYKGADYAASHTDETVDIYRTYHPEQEKEIAKKGLVRTIEEMRTAEALAKGLGWMSSEKMQRTLDLTLKSLKIEKPMPLESIYTNEFLPGK